MNNGLWIIKDFMSSIKEIAKIAVVIAVIVLLIVILKKTKHGGKLIAVLICAVIIGLGGITGYANYQYMTANGGIWGSFGDLFKGKNEINQNGLSFEITSFQLVSNGNENEFSAKISIKNVDISMKDKAVFVNDSPTTLVSRSDNYIFADYTYTFFDEDLNELASDTLTLKFVFNTKTTVIKKTDETGKVISEEIKNDFSYLLLTSKGGLKNAKYWNRFIQKNNFVVNIKTEEFKANEDMVIETPTDYLVNMYLEDELMGTTSFNVVRKPNLLSTYKNFKIISWKDENGNIVDIDNLPYENINLYAEVEYSELVYDLNDFTSFTKSNCTLYLSIDAIHGYDITIKKQYSSNIEKNFLQKINTQNNNFRCQIEISNLGTLKNCNEISKYSEILNEKFFIFNSYYIPNSSGEDVNYYNLFSSIRIIVEEDYYKIIFAIGKKDVSSCPNDCEKTTFTELQTIREQLNNDFDNQSLSFNCNFKLFFANN